MHTRFGLAAAFIITCLGILYLLPAATEGPVPSPPPAEATAIPAEHADTNGLAAEQVLHRGNFLEPETLDPHKARGAEAANILRDLYEGLTREGADGSILPGVARSWEVSEDALRHTFHLRPDARWSNGDPLTAADFVFAFRRSVDPATGSVFADYFRVIRGADDVLEGGAVEQLGVHARDAHTLVIELIRPVPYLHDLLAHHSTYPVHRPSLEQHGERFTRPEHHVGNGAFRLVDWRVNDVMHLAANPEYWDAAAVRLSDVYYYPIDDSEAEYNRFRAGQLDITQTLPVARYRQLAEDSPEALRVAPYLSTYYYGLNVQQPPFKGAPGLRRALSLVIDRDVIADKVLGIGELPSWSLTPPGMAGYPEVRLDYADWPMAQRLAEARELYAAAGYDEDQPLELEVRINSGEVHRKVALAVSTMWRQALGVETRIISEEWRVFVQTRRQRQDTQVYRAGWVGDYNDPLTFLQTLLPGSPVNDTGYSSEQYARTMLLANEERDPERRMERLAAAERLMLADHPVIPLYVYVSKHMVAPHVGGWEDNIMDHHPSRDLFIRAH
ncbi:MAG: peptide ABC transporter substrate-binding protein [Gammaproteobacteria bacterium]|nr:peptide ABC transporter substrate-binding protein [Gammaproteobacteria bacterium]